MYNGHADVTALIDNTGVIATYYYDAFGNIQENTGNANNPFKYAGCQYDDEIGSYYLNARYYDPAIARYYDPAIARFLSEDTYGGSADDPLSLNLYTYCHNEPLMYSDPTGHDDVVVTTEDGSETLDDTDTTYDTGAYTDIDSIHSSRKSGYTETPEYDKKKRLFYLYNKELQRNVFIEYDTTQSQQDAPVYFDDGERLNGTTMKVTVVNSGDGKIRVNTKQYYQACGYKNVQVTKKTDQVNASANDVPEAHDVVAGSGVSEEAKLRQLAIDFKNASGPIDSTKAFIKFGVEDWKQKVEVLHQNYYDMLIAHGISPEYAEYGADVLTGDVLGTLGGSAISGVAGGIRGVSGISTDAKSALDIVPKLYRDQVKNAFKGTITKVTNSEDVYIYRHWGGRAEESGSPWYSIQKYSPEEAKAKLALPGYNTAQNVTVFKIPKGSTYLVGEAESMVGVEGFGDYAIGGGTQIYLPDPSVAVKINIGG